MEKEIAYHYGRFLELEDLIPVWQSSQEEKRREVRYLQRERDLKEIEYKRWQEPGFFQRLLGKTEEKREKARQEYREAAAECDKLQREMEELTEKIAAGTEEKETLAGSESQYKVWREVCREAGSDTDAGRLTAAALAPAAIGAATRCLEALGDARGWARTDARMTRVAEGNRKMEFLAEAEKNAKRLNFLLEQMPEGMVETGNYLKHGTGYIVGVTSEFKQLDRLNLAMEQVREIRSVLRKL